MRDLQVSDFFTSVRNYQNVLKRTLIRIGIETVLYSLLNVTQAASSPVLHAPTVSDLRSSPSHATCGKCRCVLRSGDKVTDPRN